MVDDQDDEGSVHRDTSAGRDAYSAGRDVNFYRLPSNAIFVGFGVIVLVAVALAGILVFGPFRGGPNQGVSGGVSGGHTGGAGNPASSDSSPPTLVPSMPTPSTLSPSKAGATALGMFTFPAPGTDNILSPKTLTASGTVQHLEPGHHLLVFLQFGSQQVYWGGDPDVLITSSGHWSGTVCVGDPGMIELWLADLGPEGLAALENSTHDYWGNGVPFLPSKLASDVTILDRITISAVRTSSTCAKREPQYYG